MEARTTTFQPASTAPASEPANPWVSAAQSAKPVSSAPTPPAFGPAAPAAASGMFGTAPANPGPSRPEIISADARTETRTTPLPTVPAPLQTYRVSEPQPSTSVTAPQRPPPPEPPAEEDDDLPYSAASRLGGLRNLLVSLGMKAVHSEGELQGRGEGLEQTFERNPERAVYAEPVGYSTAHGVGETLPPDPNSVKAKPEFLPPRQVVETAEREKEPPRPVAKRLRWDAPDDVETLPSWRGQYRKRR